MAGAAEARAAGRRGPAFDQQCTIVLLSWFGVLGLLFIWKLEKTCAHDLWKELLTVSLFALKVFRLSFITLCRLVGACA